MVECGQDAPGGAPSTRSVVNSGAMSRAWGTKRRAVRDAHDRCWEKDDLVHSRSLHSSVSYRGAPTVARLQLVAPAHQGCSDL